MGDAPQRPSVVGRRSDASPRPSYRILPRCKPQTPSPGNPPRVARRDGNSLNLTATWRLIGHRLCRPRKSSFMDGVVPGGGFGAGKTVRASVAAALFLALWVLPLGHAKSEGAVEDKHGNRETRCETPPGAAGEQ